MKGNTVAFFRQTVRFTISAAGIELQRSENTEMEDFFFLPRTKYAQR